LLQVEAVSLTQGGRREGTRRRREKGGCRRREKGEGEKEGEGRYGWG
jgi:hypothetical protein